MYNWVQETGTNRHVLFIDNMIAGTLYYDGGDNIHKFFVANLIQPSTSVPVYYIESDELEKAKKILKNRIKTYRDYIETVEITMKSLVSEVN